MENKVDSYTSNHNAWSFRLVDLHIRLYVLRRISVAGIILYLSGPLR